MSTIFNFNNSYAKLPDLFYTKLEPTTALDSSIVILNDELAQELDLDLSKLSKDNFAQIFSGSLLPDGAEPLAQAYAGHQFGHFAILGDGRAHLIGEHITKNGERFDIHLKGSGKTSYARGGDGRAALAPMLREYIISEAMHNLNVPTTRSLAVTKTGEHVYREEVLQGAVLTRVASSHIRVGTFEYIAAQRDVEALRKLADYTVDRHYKEIKNSDNPYQELIKAVMKKQISLVVNWLRVGFIHGVMNTDNMLICGQTIDYGPCAFMDEYDPNTVFSSIDRNRRYAYSNQPQIARWNIARFAESLLPLLHEDIDKALELGEEIIGLFDGIFQKEWLDMMRKKLGLFGAYDGDSKLIGGLLQWMQKNNIDYTNNFRALICETPPSGKIYSDKEFVNWWKNWQERLKQNNKPLESSFCLMRDNNPAIIPRNHKVEEALSAAESSNDFSKLHKLLNALSKPYEENDALSDFCQLPKPEERVYQTFCGT